MRASNWARMILSQAVRQAEVEPGSTPHPGQAVGVALDLTRLHIFGADGSVLKD